MLEAKDRALALFSYSSITPWDIQDQNCHCEQDFGEMENILQPAAVFNQDRLASIETFCNSLVLRDFNGETPLAKGFQDQFDSLGVEPEVRSLLMKLGATPLLSEGRTADVYHESKLTLLVTFLKHNDEQTLGSCPFPKEMEGQRLSYDFDSSIN